MKIDLILRPDEFTSFTSYYLEDFWRNFFNISYYDSNKTYDKNNTVFVVWWMSAENDLWPREMKDQGYKIAVDNLWDRRRFREDFYWIEHEYSMRWNESLWWRALGYADYFPLDKPEYLSLMQLRQRKPARDYIISELNDLLDRMLWSYLAIGKRLPNDTLDEQQGQRYMHPSWYGKTYCTVLVETFLDLPLHVSEKSYKPLAYYHPFLSVSAPGTLAFLKEAGFETFDNIFDESYDNMLAFEDRISVIKSNLKNIDIKNGYDKLTLDKMKHTHDLFFNETRVKEEMHHNIVLPLLEYAAA